VKKRTFSKQSMKNLAQYKDLSDEEFEKVWDTQQTDSEPVREFENRIELKISEFENDYDISDLKFNDLQVLRSLAQALITIEDLEIFNYKLRMEGISDQNLNLMDKIGRQVSQTRSDISKMQDDLKITRKIRKGDKELTVLSEIERLKTKAKEFYESKMNYVFCHKCNMLLSTAWFLYPNAKNRMTLTCNRKLDSGGLCNTIIKITTKELLGKRGTNKSEIMPESLI